MDGKPEGIIPKKAVGHDLADLDKILTAGSGKGDSKVVDNKEEVLTDEQKAVLLDEEKSYEDYKERLSFFKESLNEIKTQIAAPGIDIKEKINLARKALIRIHKIQKDCQREKFFALSSNIRHQGSKIKKNNSAYEKRIKEIDQEMEELDKENTFFVSGDPQIQVYLDELKAREELHQQELNKKELIDKYFFREGVSQVIIHGVKKPYLNKETGEEETNLAQKIDLDVWSAMETMHLGGVRFKEDSKTSWIDPKEKLQYDEDGKPFFNQDGEKLYLEPGTVVIDVANTYGVNVVSGDIIQIDHHTPDKKDITSTTKQMFDFLKQNPTFVENFKENTETDNLEWFENYVDFVTKVDNLDYDVNPSNWNNYNNTMYAVQKRFNSFNREVILDLFKNHPDIHFGNFTKEELDYVIAVGDKGQDIDKKTNTKKISLKNLQPLRFKGEYVQPEFFENHYLGLYNEKNLIKLCDLVEFQKSAVYFANKKIKENEAVMYLNGLNTKSPVLGKIIIDEIDSFSKDRNPFGAVSAYGNGYDSYLILNLNGDQKNEIFVSTKKDPNEFANRLRQSFEKELGDKNPEELVVVVRDSMIVVRDEVLKTMDTGKIRDIISRDLEIDGHSKEKVMEEIKKKIETSINTDKRKESIDKIETMLNRYNLNLK